MMWGWDTLTLTWVLFLWRAASLEESEACFLAVDGNSIKRKPERVFLVVKAASDDEGTQ